MSGHEYMVGILNKQKMLDKDVDTLRRLRGQIENYLRNSFGSSPRFYYGGSYGKNTMIRESFDLDIVIYFPSTNTLTVKDLYESVYRVLRRGDYIANKKNVAIQLPYDGGFHIDVVPGKARDNTYRYATLYKNKTGTWIQTSLKIHIDSVKDVRDIVKLMKVWRIRHSVPLDTFPLEQLVVRALHNRRKDDYATCVSAVLIFMRDQIMNIRLTDPANSNNVLEISRDDRGRIRNVAQQGISAQYWSQVIW